MSKAEKVMKHWIEGRSEKGHGEKCILLKEEDRILSVVKNKNRIIFTEECDGYFSQTYTKKEALELIDELLEWIKSD